MTRTVAGRKRPVQPSISVIVEHPGWRNYGGLVETARRAARLALATPKCDGDTRFRADSVTILLSGDQQIQELNGRFRNRRKPTNVLAFPAVAQAWPYAGDVVLAYGVVRSEADAQGKSLAAHAAHLTIHGVLHLLGYDHHRAGDAKVMENLEVLLLQQFGFANPYQPVPVPGEKIRNKLVPCPKMAAR